MKNYHKKMLVVVDDTANTKFGMSSPTKISKKAKRAFSLPAGKMFACPGETKACDGCYATKGRHIFSNVQKAFARNWIHLLDFEKKKDKLGCAHELSQHMPKKGLFRIHESGDFHSQFAIDVWSLVVQMNPNVDFYAYTRSFHLNFKPLLSFPNFVLWASTDDFNLKKAKAFVKKYKVKHAYGPWDGKGNKPKNSFICPATSGKIEVAGACEKCQLCIMPNRTNKNVVFLSH